MKDKNEKPFSFSFRAVIYDDVGRFLLIRRTTACKSQSLKWEFPGGKFNPGEIFDDALHREIEEETGLTVDLSHAVGMAQFEVDSFRVVCVIMEGKHISGNLRLSQEHDMHAWVFPKEAIKLDLVDWFREFIESHLNESKS